MIQRKQTLYLLLSGILMLLTLFIPMARVTTYQKIYTMDTTGMTDMAGQLVYPTWILMALSILIVLLSFISIFLYKNRTLQMRMTMFNLILKPGLYALAVYYLLSFGDMVGYEAEGTPFYSVTPWVALPILAMILDYLAHRGIAIDDRTIKYMDRLR